MQTITFKSIFEAAVRACGWGLDNPEVAERQETIAELITDWVAKAFDYEFWPQTMRVDERTKLGTSPAFYVAKGDRWDESPIGNVDMRAALFVDRPVPPRLRNALGQVCEVDGKLYCNDSLLPDAPWAYYQQVAPEFSTVDYDAATSYSQGDVRYDETTGECYMSRTNSNLGNAVTNTTYWKKMEFPAFLRTAIKWGVAAEFLSEEEGKYRTEAKAWGELERLREKVLQGSGNAARAMRNAV